MVTENVHLPNPTSDNSQIPSLSRYVPADETFSAVSPSPRPSRKWRSHEPMSDVTLEPPKAPEITPEMISGASMPPPGAFIPASLPFAPDSSSSRSTQLTTMMSTALQAPYLPPPYPGKNPIPEALREAGIMKFELVSFTSDKKAPDCPHHIPLKTDNLVPDKLEDDIDEGVRRQNRKVRLCAQVVRYHYHCAVVWGPSDPVPEYAEPGDVWINTGQKKAIWIVNKDGKHVQWPGNLLSDRLLSDRLAHPWATDLYLWYGGRNGWNWWSKSRHIDSARLRLTQGLTKFAEWLMVKYQGREDQHPSLGIDVDAVEHWLEKRSETAVTGKKRKADGDRRPSKRSGGEPPRKHTALPNQSTILPTGPFQGVSKVATTSQHVDNSTLIEGSPPPPDEQLLLFQPSHIPAEVLEQVTSAAPDDESMHHFLLAGCPVAESEGSQSQQDRISAPSPALASAHITIPEPETATKTPSAAPAGAQFFTIKHKTRTVLARCPKTYQAALDLAHKHFKSLTDKEIYFQTTQVDFAAGQAVELPDDIWVDIIDSLTTVEVVERTEETAPASDTTTATGSAAGLEKKSYSAPPTPLSPFC